MKDKIKELVKSGEHEELIIEALIACNNVRDHFNSVPMNGVFSGVADAWHCGEDLKQALTPKKKPVDMSVFVDSPIDCEFSRGESAHHWYIGELRFIDSPQETYGLRGVGNYRYCRPRMNYWFSIDLFANACDCGKFIENLESAGFDVDANYFDGYLRSFKVTGLREGYCWPWECEW